MSGRTPPRRFFRRAAIRTVTLAALGGLGGGAATSCAPETIDDLLADVVPEGASLTIVSAQRRDSLHRLGYGPLECGAGGKRQSSRLRP
ncbi:MAG: hypothetical protein ACRDUA_25765, partial [Micromonosporaceae bacterium]